MTETLAPTQIDRLAREFPTPVRVESIGPVDLSIYRAKSLFSPEWVNPAAKRLVLEARKSYKMYGDVPLEDQYDAKSAIYLSRLDYLRHGQSESAWFTVRFVPGSGTPAGSEDLNFYTVLRDGKKTSVLSALEAEDPQILDRTVAISRLAPLRPYASSGGGRETHGRTARNPAIAFAAMNEQFLREMDGRSTPLLTSQIHAGLRRLLGMPFTEAHAALRVPPEAIQLDRTHPDVYAYRFPTYFLDTSDLVKSLNDLASQDKLSRRQVAELLTSVRTHPDQLGEFLSTHGQLPGAPITGEELRTYLNENVRDGSVLCIMQANEWQESARALLDQAKTYGGT